MAGIYGDLQGIADKSLQEIKGLEMRALGVDDDSDEPLAPQIEPVWRAGSQVPAWERGKRVRGGLYAVVRHIGTTERISDGVDYLFRDWLPCNGEELEDCPLFFHYIKRVPYRMRSVSVVFAYGISG